MLGGTAHLPTQHPAPSPARRLDSITRTFATTGITSGSMAESTPVEAQQKPLQPDNTPYNWPTSPVPENPLGKDRFIQTAACLIIGDEVLNGKTKDSNSNFLAKLLFDLGVDLKRIEVIADDEDEIIEAARRMVSHYDFVVTSGGIGPTHDDITYQSIAKAFDPEGELVYHDETIRRMDIMIKRRLNMAPQTPEQQKARRRMALLPKKGEALHVHPELWVPVVRMEGKLCILPGVPTLFQQLLEGLVNYLPLPPTSSKPFRHLIHTNLPESSIAPFLTDLQARVKKEGIRVGSYPKMHVGVDVSLIGKDQNRLKELEEEVCRELQGEVVKAGKLGEEK